jgi:hypothetical protein
MVQSSAMYDRKKIVIDSRQLTGDESKALTGCDMVTPGMPPSKFSQSRDRKVLAGVSQPR